MIRPETVPPGQHLSIGSAVIEITDVRHKGHASFVERYGREAAIFVNGPGGDGLRLRGTYRAAG